VLKDPAVSGPWLGLLLWFGSVPGWGTLALPHTKKKKKKKKERKKRFLKILN